MLLGRIIRAWREKQRLGIRALAKEVGTSAATLGRFENGKNPDGDTLAKILIWALSNSEFEIR